MVGRKKRAKKPLSAKSQLRARKPIRSVLPLQTSLIITAGKKKKRNRPRKPCPPDPQPTSLFMQLPQEIRDIVYDQLFCMIRLITARITVNSSAWETKYHTWSRYLISAFNGNALAILSTCQRIRAEIGYSWLSKVLFVFSCLDKMMYTLAALPESCLQKIRHVRVHGRYLRIQNPTFSGHDAQGSISEVDYSITKALKLLPGLALDRLTVMDNAWGSPKETYVTLNELINCGQGWRELHFMSRTSDFLAPAKCFSANHQVHVPILDRYTYFPQPAQWQKWLQEKDGETSNPSVTIYRASRESRCGLIHDSTREIFDTDSMTPHDAHLRPTLSDLSDEIKKQVLVVVKRGKGAQYAEKEGSEYLFTGDIREDYDVMFGISTWEEIVEMDLGGNHKDSAKNWKDPDADWASNSREWRANKRDFNRIPKQLVVVDEYDCIDEYDWPKRKPDLI